MFSLAICTYNRATLLRQALQSLADSKAPADQWELLLIDNNSRDGTSVAAHSFHDRLPLRYIFERKQGLSLARNRALRECRGDVVLFTDDDLTFDKDWLLRYDQAFSSKQAAGWFGGRILPRWPNGCPKWLHDESMALISGLLVRYDLGPGDRPYGVSDPAPFGASFALRRGVFEQVGGFRPDLGVRGDSPGRGEEAEYFRRVQSAGHDGYYVGGASAWHWQDTARFQWLYLYRYGIQKGIAAARMSRAQGDQPGSRAREVKYGLKSAWQLLRGRGDRARQCVINMGIERGMRYSCRK